jgi:hypothetical protein
MPTWSKEVRIVIMGDERKRDINHVLYRVAKELFSSYYSSLQLREEQARDQRYMYQTTCGICLVQLACRDAT